MYKFGQVQVWNENSHLLENYGRTVTFLEIQKSTYLVMAHPYGLLVIEILMKFVDD